MWALIAIGIGLLVFIGFIWWVRHRSDEADYFEREFQGPPMFDAGRGV